MHGPSYPVIAPVQSEVLTKGDRKAQNKDLYRRIRPCRSSRSSKGLMALAAFVALSAVIFTVFRCSLIVRRRILSLSNGRRMAEDEGGNGIDEDSDTCNISSLTESLRDSPTPMHPHFGSQNDREGGSMASTQSNGRRSRRTGKPRLRHAQSGSRARTLRLGAKRTAEEAFSTTESSLPPRHPLQPQLNAAPPLDPPPPLDPEIDELIDSVLAVGENVVLAASGLRQALQEQDSASDSSSEPLSPDATIELFDHDDTSSSSAALSLDPDIESFIDSVLDGGEEALLASLHLGGESPPPPLDPDIDLLIDYMLAKEEEDLLADSNFREEDLLSPVDDGAIDPVDSVVGRRKSFLPAGDGNLDEDVMIWAGEGFSEPLRSRLSGEVGKLDEDAGGTSSAEVDSETSPTSRLTGSAWDVLKLSGTKPGSFRGVEGLATDDWLHGPADDVPSELQNVLLPSLTSPVMPDTGESSIEAMTKVLYSLFGDADGQISEVSPLASGQARDSSNMPLHEEAESPPFEVSPPESPFARDPGHGSEQNVSSSAPSAAITVQHPPPRHSAAVVPQASEQSASAYPTNVARNFLGWVKGVYPLTSDDVLKTHPLYRHPKSPTSLRIREFNQTLASSLRSFHFSINAVLWECRNLLRKESLSEADYELLMAHTERLCGYASGCMAVSPRRNRPLQAVETLGTVLLVLDTLYCLSETLGESSKKEVWWPWVVSHIQNARYVPNVNSRARTHHRELDVALSLNVALGYYKEGKRPPMRLLIGLKEALLCTPGSSKFRSRAWDFYRRDVTEWSNALPGNAPAGEQSPQPSTSSRQ